jgi:hypothetical protein
MRIVLRKLVILLITVFDTSRQSKLMLASSTPNGLLLHKKRPFSVIPKGSNLDVNLKKTKSDTLLVCIPDTFLQRRFMKVTMIPFGMFPWKKSVLSVSRNGMFLILRMTQKTMFVLRYF